MSDPAWAVSPPEANHLRLLGVGAAGTATTLASGAAWQALVASNELACSLSTSNTACTAAGFAGVGGAASAAAATALNGSLHMLAGWAEQKAGIAAAAVSAYEAAASAMIPAEISIANRTQQAADVAMNPLVFGMLTPAIIALDIEYFGEHWPHNAGIGIAYGLALAGLTAALAVPPPLPPTGSSAGSAVAAAESVTQSASQAAAGEAMKQSSRAADETRASSQEVAQGALEPLTAAANPLNALGGFLQPMRTLLDAPLQSLSGVPRGADRESVPAWDGEYRPPDLPLVGSTPHAGAVGISASPGGSVTGARPGSLTGSAAIPTTYVRPATTFPTELSGRPAGLQRVESGNTEQRTFTTGGVGALPAPPPARSTTHSDETGPSRVRIALAAGSTEAADPDERPR